MEAGIAGTMGRVRIGARTLRVPPGLDAVLGSDPTHETEVNAFVRASPDRCVYHLPAYINFARAQNGVADLLLLARSGRALVGLPMHPQGRTFYGTGYSGILLPDSESESVLRLSTTALQEFLGANPSLGYECLQAAQAGSYEDALRCAMVDSLLTGPGIAKRELYSRVIRLEPENEALTPDSGMVPAADLDNELIRRYDGKKRSEIRQAIRSGVRVVYDLLTGEDDGQRAREAYGRYLSIHQVSWQRTGLRPHADDYWLSLSEAVRRAGGRDLVVVALAPDGAPVAAVNCHLYQRRALYWSGGSLVEGMTLKANPLCLHAAISLCRRDGIAVFEVGRFDPAEISRKEQAINAYKAQFRGSVVRLVNFHRPPSNAGYRLRAAGARIARAVRRIARRDA